MKRTVLVAAVILVACPLLPWARTSAQAQTTDQHGWIGTETVKTCFDFEFKNDYPTAEAKEKTSSMSYARSTVRSNRICTS